MLRTSYWTVALLLALPRAAGAYEVSTHRALTSIAVEARATELSGLVQGSVAPPHDLDLDHEVTVDGATLSLKHWILRGSEEEDTLPLVVPEGRVIHHFHDPLEPVASAGLSFPPSALSSVAWAVAAAGVQKSRQSQTGAAGDRHGMSWPDARAHYLRALTAPTASARDRALGLAFKALGHVMHLVQDASVPAHVRDDPHLSIAGYGDPDDFHVWVAMNNHRLATLAAVPVRPPASLLRRAHPEVVSPIANLIDTDRYDGTLAEATLPAGADIGIAEYANANFFSEDTIRWAPAGPGYPHPSSPGASDVPFEGPGPMDAFDPVYYRLLRFGQDYVVPLVFRPVAMLGELTLEDGAGRVHEAYLARLAPYAVGYSAEVPAFFLRSPVSVSVQGGDRFRLESTSDESADGTVTLYYDSTAGERRPIMSWSLALAGHAAGPEWTFQVPQDAREPGQYLLVFEGRLGAEEGAVWGKRFEVGGVRLVSVAPTGVVPNRLPEVKATIEGPGGPGYLFSVLTIETTGAQVFSCCDTAGGEVRMVPFDRLPLGEITARIRAWLDPSGGETDTSRPPALDARWSFVVDVGLTCTGGLSHDSFSGDFRGFGHERYFDWSCDLGGEPIPLRIYWLQGECVPGWCSSPFGQRFTIISPFYNPTEFVRYSTTFAPAPDFGLSDGSLVWQSFPDVSATVHIMGKAFTALLPTQH